MELLIGSGNNHKKQVHFRAIPEEWCELVTLDWDDGVNPDVLHDLTKLPLPFDDDMFDEIHGYEVLEHCGQQGDWRLFFRQFEEFWRILKPGGYFIATVPRWDSPWAWGDPGQTRIITDGSLSFLSQEAYKEQVGKTAMTDYRPWYQADFDFIAKHETDDQFGFVLRAVKPMRTYDD